VTLTIVPAPYDEADLVSAMNRVFDAARAGTVPRPSEASPDLAYAGIEVGYPEVPQGADGEVLRARLSGIAGMPVTLEQADPPVG
jgi:hypothetical protein